MKLSILIIGVFLTLLTQAEGNALAFQTNEEAVLASDLKIASDLIISTNRFFSSWANSNAASAYHTGQMTLQVFVYEHEEAFLQYNAAWKAAKSEGADTINFIPHDPAAPAA